MSPGKRASSICGPRFVRIVVLFFAARLLLGVSALGLDPARTVYQYGCENWSRRNGLPVNSVKAITQTADGYLWLGTQQGLVRFDGIGFTSFQLDYNPAFVSQNISALARSRDGGLWFGLREGSVGYFDGKNFSPLKAAWVEPNMQVFSVTEAHDGSLWVGWNFGYSRWLKDRALLEPSEQSIGFVPYQVTYEDPQGRVWLATGDSGQLYYWEAGERHRFPDDTLAQCYFFALAVDGEGNLWVGTQKGLRCYDKNFQRKALPLVTEAAQVNALLVDRHGVLWVGMEGTGLLRYQDGAFTEFRTDNGLVDDFVTALFEDAEGSLWIGTRGGLSQLTDIKFPLYSATEGLMGEPLGVAPAADGGVWVGTRKGINHFGGAGVVSFGTEVGMENNYIKRVWEAANGDVYYFDGNRGLGVLANGRIVARHANRDWPVSITEDQHGVIVALGGELYRASRTELTPFRYNSGKSPPLVWPLNLWPARDGSLWAAGHRGVWRIKDGEYEQWSPQNGLSGLVANWVFEDIDGAVWVGLATGIARIKDGKVRNISRADGLFVNFIYAIVPDDFGWFWFDSTHGIFRVRREQLNAFADGRVDRIDCETFNAQHAIKSTDKTRQEPTAAKTRDGRIWFPTTQGVVVIDPAHVPTNRVPPPVYLQHLRINGVEIAGKAVPKLPAGRGELEFHYAALSFIASQNIRYRYRLEGYDEGWVDAGDRRSAFYTNLKPGHYVYRVQACNADGVWSPQGDSIAFELPPHFYQTGWFVALCGLTAAAGLFGVYGWRTRSLRLRERRLQELNELLEAKVRERTAELAQVNVSLTEEIAERKRFEEEAAETHKRLLLASRQAGMAEVATSVLHNVGNVLSSVNVSSGLILDNLRRFRVPHVGRVAQLLAEHAATPAFLSADPKGKQIPAYLEQLAQHLTAEQAALAAEMESLQRDLEHINDIVQMQQNYSRMAGVHETVRVSEIVDDALRLNNNSLARHHVKVECDYGEDFMLVVEKHKVLQILVNLLNNAKQACERGGGEGLVWIRVRRAGGNRALIQVIDNGVGIAPEHRERIFTQGFTTRKDGHGYGLHNSANAAQSMGGRLTADSEGIGRGATFTLELPIEPGGV